MARSDARIAQVIGDPATRLWVKRALETALDRDPVDAAYDAALVAELLGERVDAMLARAAPG